ncbi:MAG: hypothetical protein DRN04_02175 [Thermoprotei archaeon]|nr:MAG: hypothetical protein DRN04_02175 [Thermoprotei archaeon]
MSKRRKDLEKYLQRSIADALRTGDYEKVSEIVSGLIIETIELTETVRELSKAVIELRKSLELERKLRLEEDLRLRGHIARVEGKLIEVSLINNLREFCSKYNLRVESLPQDPYRVDAVIYGKKLIALVEIAKTGEFTDIEQLLEGARIFEKIRGEKPNALILFIYAEKPSEKLMTECEKVE